MIDRNVEFPNRFRMTKVEGTDDIYDLIPAPGEVIAPGDTFSKANMLPDSIPAALGLKMGNPQVKDALNVLANVGNVHVWDRTIFLEEEIPAGYELGPVSSGSFVIGGNSSRQDSTWTYGTEISVDDGGNVSLTGDTATVSGYNSYTGELVSTLGILVGKFAKCTDTVSGTTIGIPENTIVFFPEDAVVTKTTRDGDTVAVINKYQSVEGHKKIPAGTTTDYLTSTDRNAYTEGTVDNTTITYLGQLGGGARIEVGSYVGTGTYGSLNPITLTFVGIPKLVIVEREQRSGNSYSNGLGVFFYGQKIAQVHWNLRGSGSSNANVVLSWNQNAVSWYGNDSSAHLNDENTTYHYIAIG